MKRIAVYAGSFDPLTNGHVDIVKKARGIFREVIVAVSDNPNKKHLLTDAQRQKTVTEALRGMEGIRVKRFKGLLVDFLRSHRAEVVIRGLRAVSDFDYEFQMALMNKSLDPDIETVFFMPDPRYTFLSSSLVKEVARLGGDVSDLAPAPVVRLLERRFGKPTARGKASGTGRKRKKK